QIGSALYPVISSIGAGSPPPVALAQLARINTSDLSHRGIITGLTLIGAVARDYALYGDDMITGITERRLVPQYYMAFLGRDVLDSVYPTLEAEAQSAMYQLEGVQNQLVIYVMQLHAA